MKQPKDRRSARAGSARTAAKGSTRQLTNARSVEYPWAVAELAIFSLLGLARFALGLAAAIAVARGQVDVETAAALSAAFLGLRETRRRGRG
jgi:hypothetical protein